MKNVTDRLNRWCFIIFKMLWCASGPGLDIIQLLLLKLLHDYTFLGPKILKIKPKKTQHLKLQLPHQVESSVDSIVRRHKSANRKSFLNSASEDENDTANEEPKVTRSAKRANIPDERTQKGNLISIMNLFRSLTTSFGKDYWNGYCDFKQASSCMNPLSTMFLANASFYELSFQLSLIIRCPSKNAW